MSGVTKSVHLAAPIEAVWAALTDTESIKGWMGDEGPLEVDLRVGGGYRFFGGETTGTFTRIARPTELEYTWRQRAWPAEWPDSLVAWKLAADGAGTRVELSHTRFPNDKERAGHDEGWDVYFLEPMKAWLEAHD